MTKKIYFSSAGTINAISMAARRTNKKVKTVTSFGPVLTKGQRFETVNMDRSMSKELEMSELSQYKVAKKAGCFILIEKPVKRKKRPCQEP